MYTRYVIQLRKFSGYISFAEKPLERDAAILGKARQNETEFHVV